MRKPLFFSCVLSMIMLFTASGQIFDTVSYPNLNDSVTIDWEKIGVSDSTVVKNIMQLTTNAGRDMVQCWGAYPFSKDGTKIVYTSEVDGTSWDDNELVMMNLDGSNKVRLTISSTCESHASFTPDGQSVVYQSYVEVNEDGDQAARIFIAPLDSMIAQPDSNWGVNLIDVEGPIFGDTSSCHLKPMISPDGLKIAFKKDDEDTIPGLFVMNIDGTGVVQISDTLEDPSHHSWSPDGEWVVFQSCIDYARVYISRADGSMKPMQVSPEAFHSLEICSNWPAWSPDGKWISYHTYSNSSNHYSIVLYNVEEKTTKFFIDYEEQDICAPTSWDPTGKWLSFKREPLSGSGKEICMINIDTEEEIILTTGYYDQRQWFTPDGNGILFKDMWGSPSRDTSHYDYDLLMINFENDFISPVVITKDISIEMTSECLYEITVADIDNGSWDNTGIENSSIDITSFDCDDIGESIEVTLTVEDAAGNISTGTALVTVLNDVIEPPTPSSISDLSGEVFLMYPNPANDQLFVHAVSASDLNLTVFDNAGRVIIQTTLNNDQSVDVSQLETGMYVVVVSGSDFTETQKLIISR